jgi:cytochrome b involved in lipid metabolism
MTAKSKAITVSLTLLIPIGIVTPTAINAAPNTTKPITLNAVKTHSSPINCRTIVNRKVYNLTAWIRQHPGGSSRIIAMCGKDASAAFNAQHAGQGSPNSNLAEYQIGIVKKKH